MVRSLIEGVSYSQKDCLDIVEELGVQVASVRASGGGAKSPLWRRILADVFGKPVATLDTQEGSAYGAALLAMVGTGRFTAVAEACRAAIRETETITPGDATATYSRGHAVYRSLYPALKEVFHGTP
jgi:xylulokinase